MLFLIYINDLSDNLSSNVKLFADDTSLFSVIHDINISAGELNEDLKKISEWAFQWKMIFDLDATKQAQEVIFSRRKKKPPLFFNNAIVSQTNSQKHLGVTLDLKLTFEEHLLNVFKTVNRTIGLIRKLQNVLPRISLVTIYKAFVRPHLDYGDILYDQAFNNSFHDRLESIQYNACLAITGAIRGTSREKLYQELGLEPLRLRRWYRKLCLFYKVFKNEHPQYLFHLIPVRHSSHTSRNVHSIPFLSVFSKTLSFLLLSLNGISIFRKNVLHFIRPAPNSIYNCHNPKGVKLITRLRLGLSHLREHKFKHNFQDSINPLCNCGHDIESTTHYPIHCPLFVNERRTFFNTLSSLDCTLSDNTDSSLTQTLLFGNTSFKLNKNLKFLIATTQQTFQRRFNVVLGLI